jgi:hypothetical protein
MSEENNTTGKILVLQEELAEIEKIREEIASKLAELQASDNKMEALTEAFTARISVLEEEAKAQPELI